VIHCIEDICNICHSKNVKRYKYNDPCHKVIYLKLNTNLHSVKISAFFKIISIRITGMVNKKGILKALLTLICLNRNGIRFNQFSQWHGSQIKTNTKYIYAERKTERKKQGINK